MPIKLHISPRLVTSVSSLYNDPNRIFMEYIDNALDSAENWFDARSNSYTRPIEITLKLEGKNKREGKVVITDNCCGITNFKKSAIITAQAAMRRMIETGKSQEDIAEAIKSSLG